MPKLLQDRKNFLVQSHSGSGKRIAMAIAILSHVNESKKYPHIVCVVPSTEAALQTEEVLQGVMGSENICSVHTAVAGIKS